MTIDEIIEEGERLEREAKAAWRNSCIADAKEATRRLSEWRNVWCPRLIAVAKAAVEMRATYGKLASLHSVTFGVPTFDLDEYGEMVQTGRTPDIDKPDCEHCRVLAAFDAAVRGDAGGEG